MKSLPIVFGISLFFIFSCKKDDPQDLIIGKWKSTSLDITDCDNPASNRKIVFTNGCFSDYDFSYCEEITFHADKSFMSKSTYMDLNSGLTDIETTEGTYTIDGGNIILCPGQNNCTTGTFSVTENSLSLRDMLDDFPDCKTDFTFVK